MLYSSKYVGAYRVGEINRMTEPITDYEQVGGKLLGLGAYGCAFMPPLLCKGETRPVGARVVGKLGRPKDLEKDYLKLKYISDNVPLASKYFTVTRDKALCEPAMKQIENPEEIRRCLREVDTIASYPLKDLRLLRMSYGGKPLDSVGSINRNTNFWKFGKHLLEGLTLLMVRGIVHADLHDGNLLVTSNGLPFIADFGNSYFVRDSKDIKINELEFLFRRNFDRMEQISRYTQEPPEVPLFNGFFGQIGIEEIVENIFKYRPKLVRNLLLLLGKTRTDIFKEINEYRANTQYFERDPNLVEWWKLHWHTYDIWSGGYILLNIMADMAKLGINFEGMSKYNDMKKALSGMLNFNCIKRLNAAQALAIWDSPNNNVIQRYAKKWL